MPRFWVDVWVERDKVTVHMSKSTLVAYVLLMAVGAAAIIGALAIVGALVYI